MENKLTHPEHGTVIISREGEVIAVFTEGGMQISENVFRTELTAKAYHHYMLLYHADMGFKRNG